MTAIRRVPGLEVYNFALPQAGPRDYAAQLASDVLAYRPDLVLTFVAVGDDITREQPLPELFDWRSLGLFQLGAGPWQSSAGLAGGHASYEDYLRNAGLRLDVCRTPISPATEECWEAALGHLGDVLSACREADIDAALVVEQDPSRFPGIAPAQFESESRQAGRAAQPPRWRGLRANLAGDYQVASGRRECPRDHVVLELESRRAVEEGETPGTDPDLAPVPIAVDIVRVDRGDVAIPDAPCESALDDLGWSIVEEIGRTRADFEQLEPAPARRQDEDAMDVAASAQWSRDDRPPFRLDLELQSSLEQNGG